MVFVFYILNSVLCKTSFVYTYTKAIKYRLPGYLQIHFGLDRKSKFGASEGFAPSKFLFSLIVSQLII